MNLIHTFLIYFSTIHSNIILLRTARSFEWFLSFSFFEQMYLGVSHLLHACYISIHFILLGLITQRYTFWKLISICC